MEVRIYDSCLNFIGIVENQTSLIWTRKYNDVGEFELYVPVTEDNTKLIRRTNIIYVSGFSEAGVIEYVITEETQTHNRITAKGRFLESYMDRRLIKGRYNFNGKVEVAMREILSNATPIPLVVFGDLNGYEDKVEFQATYKNLLEYETKLAKSANFGYRFRPDFNSKSITFEIYKGTDRTRSQGVNNRVVFSENYDNINEAVYTENDQLYKNVAYVGGEGEGTARTFVKVGDLTEGLELREMFVDARDIQKEEMTDAEYVEKLRQRGLENLKNNMLSTSFECKTEASKNFIYKVNYDLGDIVTVHKRNWGIEEDLRITEIQEVYEYGGMQVVPTLGTPLPTKAEWEDN